MVIDKIHVKNFRNYTDTSFAFSGDHNFIVGKNGTGKTNVIEAVTIVSNVRSFRGVHDSEIIQWGYDSYFCGASVSGSDDSLFEVGCAIHNDRVHRKLKIDGAETRKLSDYFGKLLTVVICPEDIRIITDGPDERRRFVDSVISKTDLSYLRTLIEFRRVLSQRNRVLKELREKKKYTDSQLDIWDELFANNASDLIHKRTAFIESFRKDFIRSYTSLSGGEESPFLTYLQNNAEGESRNIIDSLRMNRTKDILAGTTTSGPQRDDYRFHNERDCSFADYSSQGQKRTAVIALKLAEKQYVEKEIKKKQSF